MTDQLRFRIPAAVEGEPGGYDSVIIKVPDRWYVTVGGTLVLIARTAIRDLQQLSRTTAEGMGEELHHAEWTITGDPGEVRTLGLMHDCEACRAGVDQALAYLRDTPAGQVAVGQLWWRR